MTSRTADQQEDLGTIEPTDDPDAEKQAASSGPGVDPRRKSATRKALQEVTEKEKALKEQMAELRKQMQETSQTKKELESEISGVTRMPQAF